MYKTRTFARNKTLLAEGVEGAYRPECNNQSSEKAIPMCASSGVQRYHAVYQIWTILLAIQVCGLPQ
jgi:hypothetical protein